MDQELKESIIIIALDNLIRTYSLILEEPQDTKNKEEREYIQYLINMAEAALGEFGTKVEQKPQWDKLK